MKRILNVAVIIILSASVCIAGQNKNSCLIGQNIAKFYDPDVNLSDLPVSLALQSEFKKIGEIPADWSVVPQFGKDPDEDKPRRLPLPREQVYTAQAKSSPNAEKRHGCRVLEY
jgi:hypothetical protein